LYRYRCFESRRMTMTGPKSLRVTAAGIVFWTSLTGPLRFAFSAEKRALTDRGRLIFLPGRDLEIHGRKFRSFSVESTAG
jgi:hypothetical protein